MAIDHVEKYYFLEIKEDLTEQSEILEREMARQKLLFVGCSRAMRCLALFITAKYASPSVSELPEETWEFIL